jgi:hypothetical protein
MTDNQADAATPADAEPTSRTDTPPAAEANNAEPSGARPPRYAPPSREQFDWRGWVLVAVVVLSFLAIPGAILYLPQAQGAVESLGLTLRDAYLALPMIPALLLGATAVWAAVRARTDDE